MTQKDIVLPKNNASEYGRNRGCGIAQECGAMGLVMKQSPLSVRSLTRAVKQPSAAAPPAPSRASLVASSQHLNTEWGRRHERMPARTRWDIHISSHISVYAPVRSAVTPALRHARPSKSPAVADVGEASF